MQLLLQEPSFSLSSLHFKEGQWRSKGPAWPFRGHYQFWVGAQQPFSNPPFSQPFCHTPAGWPHAGDTGWLQSQLSSRDQS